MQRAFDGFPSQQHNAAYFDDNSILHSIIIVQLCGNFWSPDFHRDRMDVRVSTSRESKNSIFFCTLPLIKFLLSF